MKDLNITAKAGKDKDAKSATIIVKAPETLAEAQEMYGDEAILTNAMANFVITEQNRVRADIKAGLDQPAIQEKHANDKMGISQPKGTADPTAAFLSKWQSMSEDEKAQVMRKMKGAAA